MRTYTQISKTTKNKKMRSYKHVSFALLALTTLAIQLAIAPAVANAAALNAGTTKLSAEGGNRIYLTGPVGAITVGQTFTIEVHENSNTQQINAVQANISYPANLLQFVATDETNTAFGVNAQGSGGGGTIIVARGSTIPLTGDRLVLKVSLKAVAVGGISINVDNGSALVSSKTNKNIADGLGYLEGQVTVQPNPGPPGNPGPVGPPGHPAPIPTTYPIPTPDPGSAPNVTITPNPTPASPEPQPTILPDQSQIDVSQPSTIETTPASDKTVQKVEYYIAGKLVMTVSAPPYSYSVDTSNLLNGRYTLTTKTYYSDGKVDSVDSVLNVSNPMNAKQLTLMLQHYAWIVILLAVAIGGFIWFQFFRKRGGGGGDNFGGDYGGDFNGGGDMPAGGPYAPPPPPGSQVNGAGVGVPTTDPNGANQQYPPTQYGQY